MTTTTSNDDTIASLRAEIKAYVQAAGFKNESPKNLAIALSIEAGELLEPFQWLNYGDIAELAASREEVKLEAADVFIYLCALADSLELDLAEAVRQKLTINYQRLDR